MSLELGTAGSQKMTGMTASQYTLEGQETKAEYIPLLVKYLQSLYTKTWWIRIQFKAASEFPTVDATELFLYK